MRFCLLRAACDGIAQESCSSAGRPIAMIVSLEEATMLGALVSHATALNEDLVLHVAIAVLVSGRKPQEIAYVCFLQAVWDGVEQEADI